jgi:hypothetical protein
MTKKTEEKIKIFFATYKSETAAIVTSFGDVYKVSAEDIVKDVCLRRGVIYKIISKPEAVAEELPAQESVEIKEAEVKPQEVVWEEPDVKATSKTGKNK